MAAPSTTGMGQGAAQVFDTSGIAQQYGQAKVLDEQQKAAQRKDEEKRLAELLGAGGDLFKQKYYSTRDDKVLREKYNKEVLEWMKGRENKIIDPSSPDAQEYRNRMQNIYFDFAMSEESKNLAKPYIEDIYSNPDLYEEETKQYAKEFQTTPLAVFDPSKIKKVNNFDLLADFDKKNSQFFTEISKNKKNLGVFEAGNGFYGQGSKIEATPQDRQNHMENVFKSWQTNDQAMDKLNRMYGEQAKEQGRNVREVAWEALYPKTAVKITDVSYGKSGDGAEEPFNPNNIVEDFDLSTGSGSETFLDLGFVKLGKDSSLGSTKTRMYQTKPIKTTHPLSTDVIDIETGKKLNQSGTYNLEMGSPIFYKEDVYVPALTDTKQSVLIPLREVKEVFEAKGYDANKIDATLRQKKGTTTKPNISAEEWNKQWSSLKAGESMTGLDGKKYTKK